MGEPSPNPGITILLVYDLGKADQLPWIWKLTRMLSRVKGNVCGLGMVVQACNPSYTGGGNGKMVGQGQPWAKGDPTWKINGKKKRGGGEDWGCASSGRYLPSKHKAPRSNASAHTHTSNACENSLNGIFLQICQGWAVDRNDGQSAQLALTKHSTGYFIQVCFCLTSVLFSCCILWNMNYVSYSLYKTL
jgi:hypothetical protein